MFIPNKKGDFMLKTITVIAAFLLTQSAFAGLCELTVVRTACSDATKAESFKKCDETNKDIKMKKLSEEKCLETFDVKKDSDCIKKAITRCENGRLDITKSKAITATFDGKVLENGKDYCDTKPPRTDFNKCDKK